MYVAREDFFERNFYIRFISIASSDSPSQSVPSTPQIHRPLSATSKRTRSNEKLNLTKYGGQNLNTILANRQQNLESKANTHIENQQFLTEIVNNVLEGLGVGWLKINRVKKLMEDENYRNFVLSRLNVNLNKRYADEDDHIDDVVSHCNLSIVSHHSLS